MPETDPKHAQVEAGLPQNGERFRLLVESVQDYAIYVLDRQGRVASWNRGAERLKGYPADEIIGRHVSLFYPPEDRDRAALELAEAAREGRYEEEGWRMRKDGSRFWASVVLTALRDPRGELVGYAKVTRDLTERRAAEEERLRRARAEEAVRARDEFLAMAAHELRTPLSTLRIQADGLARALEKGKDAVPHERLVARIATIRAEVGRLEGLVGDLLDVSRITAGRLELRPEPMDLAELARDVVARLEDAIAPTGSQVFVRAPDMTMGVWDRARLEQVLANLLTNAAKYGRAQPIDVLVEGDPTTARLVVRDRGIGIAPAQQTRIFERFERAPDARRFGGFGLGLWITRQIVELHRGSIRVESQPGAGATFTVELPRRV